MRRRQFIMAVAGAAVAWPLAAGAQKAGERLPRVGVLLYANQSDPEEQVLFAAFLQELARLGWRDHENVDVDVLWARGDLRQLRSNAAQLIGRGPEVIVAGSAAARAALDETQDKPIIFVNVTDPIGLGLVRDLAHPGGNITGFYNYDFAMAGKWLETLKEIAPRVKHVVILGSSAIPSYEDWVRAAQDFAPSFGVEIEVAAVGDAADIEHALEATSRKAGGGVMALPGSFISLHRDIIIGAARRLRLPAIYPRPAYSQAGGLLSYGIDIPDIYRRAATYVDRILKGAKPGELPVQAPAKFELVINMKTAQELGLDVPQQLRLLADQLIR